MDKTLRLQILQEVRAAIQQAAETNNEVWLNADDLCQQFGMFTKDWLKRYGSLLPRMRVEVLDKGEMHCTRWAYPRNKIQRMIHDNELRLIV